MIDTALTFQKKNSMSMIEDYSPSQHARRYAAIQREGADVRSLLIFPDDSMDQKVNIQPKIVKPKNHAKSNIQMLKEAQMKRQIINEEKKLKMLNELQKEKMVKDLRFHHVKPKVFEDKTASTVNEVPCVVPLSTKSKLHKNYGQIPEYILKFRIAEANKENRFDHIDSPLQVNESLTSSKCYKNKQEKLLALKQLTLEERRIKETITKMPFGIQSDKSIQKRKLMEIELQRVRKEIVNIQR